MAKIMLVEDDNNLREIYGERLIAEGYEIVSAKDGEEALALAVKEKPDLIISDVMMPKISGFDMLDILRQTPETKNTKVIMMTALSQAEDKQRANSLGADKYLVKSQVTLEDVARVVDDVLNDRSGPMQVPATEEPTTNEAPSVQNVPTNTEVAPAPPIEMASEPQPVVQSVESPTTEEVAPVQEIAPAEPVVAPQEIPAEPVVTPENEVQNPVNSQTDAPSQPVPSNETPEALPAQPANPMVETAPAADANSMVDANNSASPESAEEALNEINKEIENFVSSDQTEVAGHQVAMVEPTQAQLDKAAIEANKDSNPDPTVIPPAADSKNIDEPASTRKKVINPINGGIDNAPSITELYEKELAAEAKDQPVVNPGAGSSVETQSAPVVQNNSTNPMVETAPAADAGAANTAPLETADLSKIEGLTTEVNEDAEESVASPQPVASPDTATQALPVEPAPAPTSDPNDPNNIAL